MTKLRLSLYDLLVNRIPGIRKRYHDIHDGSYGLKKMFSWVCLLLMNFAYYCLFLRFLGRLPDARPYRYVRSCVGRSESGLFISKHAGYCKEDLIGKLSSYDVISFDLFDTLVFRPLDDPTDVFFFLGEKTGVLDFKRKRIEAEKLARQIRKEKFSDAEVTIGEIWEVLGPRICMDPKEGADLESETESELCFANPLLNEVWNELLALGKKLIVTSDMYLPEDMLCKLLTRCGYHGWNKVFVSCEYRKNKYEGLLYEEVRKTFPGLSMAHVGDNRLSDIKRAKEHGLDTFYVPNINESGNKFRAKDMSSMTGSAYRGIVNSHLYSGLKAYNPDYEYGYVYGGLFVLGYCAFIHEQAQKNGAECIVFLSRDGDTLKRAYDILYPEDTTKYAYWSRKAAVRLCASYDRIDYFERFIFQKTGKGIKLSDILSSMGLSGHIGRWSGSIDPDDELTYEKAMMLQSVLESDWDFVQSCYEQESRLAGIYYKDLLNGCGKAAVVDIGWAGSGARALEILCGKKWDITCDFVSIVAGTNTIYCTTPDASEPFIQSKRMMSYMYSQAFNRDILKFHDPGRGFNIFFEVLLSSDSPQFDGFDAGSALQGSFDIYLDKMNTTLHFGDMPKNIEGIRNIREGILDFARDYTAAFSNYPYMNEISGRDAYAPIIAASGHGGRFLRSFCGNFEVNPDVI